MRPNNETRTIFKHDLDRLIEQVDQLCEDRLARNAKIARLETQLADAVDMLRLIAQHARLDHAERGIAEAERYVLIAEDAISHCESCGAADEEDANHGA